MIDRGALGLAHRPRVVIVPALNQERGGKGIERLVFEALIGDFEQQQAPQRREELLDVRIGDHAGLERSGEKVVLQCSRHPVDDQPSRSAESIARLHQVDGLTKLGIGRDEVAEGRFDERLAVDSIEGEPSLEPERIKGAGVPVDEACQHAGQAAGRVGMLLVMPQHECQMAGRILHMANTEQHVRKLVMELGVTGLDPQRLGERRPRPDEILVQEGPLGQGRPVTPLRRTVVRWFHIGLRGGTLRIRLCNGAASRP